MIHIESFYNVSYGMYIVSSGEAHAGNGFISNSVIQVTSSPAQFAVCCSKKNYSAELIIGCQAYAISVLGEDTPSSLIGTFGFKSGKTINKLNGLTVNIGQTGIPLVLDATLSVIECKLIQAIDTGSHLLFIGEALMAQNIASGTPLTYSHYRNEKKGFAPKNAPTYIDKSLLAQNADDLELNNYKCSICGYTYNPNSMNQEISVPMGTRFKDLPLNWNCPICGATKDNFIQL